MKSPAAFITSALFTALLFLVALCCVVALWRAPNLIAADAIAQTPSAWLQTLELKPGELDFDKAARIMPPAPPTVQWVNDEWKKEHDTKYPAPPDGLPITAGWTRRFIVDMHDEQFEMGLRSDGAVVWRKVAEKK